MNNSVLAADEGQNVLSLFINSLLRLLLQIFIDFHLPYVAMNLYNIPFAYCRAGYVLLNQVIYDQSPKKT